MKPIWLVLLACAWGRIAGGGLALADEVSSSPYIDGLKEEMREKGEPTEAVPRSAGSPDPYLQEVRGRLNAVPTETSQGYTEQLKNELSPSPAVPYTEEMKARLGPAPAESAIEAVKEGRSELQARKVGEIHHAFGLQVGTSMTRDISSSSGLQSFDNVYGDGMPLDLNFFYEYQPWHSEWFGNIGFFGQAGAGYYSGLGAFQFQVHKAGTTNENFSGTSQTKFQFFSIPIAVGINYRLNILRLFRPFVMAGGTAVGFYEQRNDGLDANTAASYGYYLSGGVSVLMDWISSRASWDLYAEHGIKHYYLSVAYNMVQTLSGDVSFGVSGIYGGFTFEF